ncbi:MAG: hypothetical protein IT495_22470 [Gammaproteobacteria bacterium]|nr:hypothetical protein [Gammaproteobacteria bacterium]
MMPKIGIGALTATVLLSLVVRSGVATARQAGESFFMELPDDGIAFTHGGNMALAAGPPGVALLSEPRVQSGLAILAKLRDASGEVVGFASELEVFPPGADMLQEVVWDTDWTLVIPGRGSLYLRQQEHSGELGAKVIIPTRESGESWRGEWIVTTTVGPRADGRGVIVGGAGEFEGATGSFLEIVTLTGFDLPGILLGRVELRLDMTLPD